MTLPVTTKRQSFAQLLFCLGCCCGRTDRGQPELPVDRLKEIWKTEKLNRSVQLTISGCLGPCDAANVTLVLLPDQSIWIGRSEGEKIYDALIEWARAIDRTKRLLPLPTIVKHRQFERFPRNESND